MNPRKPPSTPPVQTPKYLNDFSKALAAEVRILLEEVGKLRDERRALQFEIQELRTLKAKHSIGGDYGPTHWHPQIAPPPEPAPPAIEASPPAAPDPRPGGWRVVHKRPERRPRALKNTGTPAPPTPPPEPPRIELPAWQNWRPNPLLAPTPVQAAVHSPNPLPTHPGLFGPPTPPLTR